MVYYVLNNVTPNVHMGRGHRGLQGWFRPFTVSIRSSGVFEIKKLDTQNIEDFQERGRKGKGHYFAFREFFAATPDRLVLAFLSPPSEPGKSAFKVESFDLL